MEELMKLEVNFKKTVGKIKPMNAVNNGPVYTDNGDQNLTNLPDFREANIPFARTHDSSICYDYGGEHTVDIHNIFTDFDADPYSPESYDFTLTDIYLGTIMRAGAKVFYRLGSKIDRALAEALRHYAAEGLSKMGGRLRAHHNAYERGLGGRLSYGY